MNIRKWTAITLLFAAVLMTGAAFADEVKVAGGGAAINTVFKPITSHFEKATGLYLVSTQSTPKDGLVSLLNGSADAATAAVSLQSMISGAEKDGIKVDAAALQQVEIAKSKTVVFVHPSNPVSKLSKDQLKGIFTGKINNWKQVGGQDKEIIVVWGKKSPGQNALFTKVILDGEPVIKEVLETSDYFGIKQNVGSNQEAIGIDPLGIADATVKVVESPEVASPIILVTKGAPSPNVQKLINFIKGDAQQYIKQ
ncbi:MAG: substrate-binding domain-containing protein [Deltaproteobacteria bacterium]|nr:substrate-binding domain-containing protein [Deltaproteobacteria bacterium]